MDMIGAPSMEPAAAKVDEALDGLRGMLAPDGYAIDVVGEPLSIRIIPDGSACSDCLVPERVLRAIIDDALAQRGVAARYELVMPGSAH